MVSKEDIDGELAAYKKNRITIATLCSHSALQIFHGARREGFRTLGICTPERKEAYESFPFAKPDSFLMVDKFADIMDKGIQDKLLENNAIVVPHGSFVEYVGPENLEKKFRVPIFGNRKTLEWERDRAKQRKWLEAAGVKMPHEYASAAEIDRKVFIKFPGAKGGSGYFTVSSPAEFRKRCANRKDAIIQEFVPGVRYYMHFFHSPFSGRTELMGMDRRIETVDESYRGWPDVDEDFIDYTVTGNQPIIIRERLLPEVLRMGKATVEASKKLLPPGMLGPFCLETVYHPKRGFTVFEISARIVAGTNLYPNGSHYSYYVFEEPMSTGRRIAREIKIGLEMGALGKIVY